MKKIIPLILCLVMLVTALPVVAFGAEDESTLEATVFPEELFSADNIPISLQEVELGAGRRQIFYLLDSIKDFDFRVRLTDGREHPVTDGKDPLLLYYAVGFEESNYSNYEEYLAYVEETHKRIKEENDGKAVAYGKTYIKVSDCVTAKINGYNTITVYAEVWVYEYDSSVERYIITTRETLSFQKECVPFYLKITPVSGLPDYFDRTTGIVDLSNTVFDIESYNGIKKQAKVVQTGTLYDLPAYELDGKKLEYRILPDSKTVLLTYYDCRYMWDVSVVKEFPPDTISIQECVFEGDTLKEVAYTVEGSYNQQYSFRKQTSGDGEAIDTFEGNEVRVRQTKLSRFCSRVCLSIGDTQQESICAHEFDSFFMNFIAKIAVLIEKIKDR